MTLATAQTTINMDTFHPILYDMYPYGIVPPPNMQLDPQQQQQLQQLQLQIQHHQHLQLQHQQHQHQQYLQHALQQQQQQQLNLSQAQSQHPLTAYSAPPEFGISESSSQTQEEPLDLSKASSSACTTPEVFKCHKLARHKAHKRRQAIKKSGRYTCDECGKPFVQQSSLITHRRIHTGEKPYRCDICQNSYGDLSTFTKHTRTHTGEKPYECEYCTQRFSQSGNCLRHKRSVHSDVFNS